MNNDTIFDQNTGTFTEDSIDSIKRSLNNLINIEEIKEIVLLNVLNFSIENFLEFKETVINGEFRFTKINYHFDKDILFFYQVSTSDEKTFAVAHRDPFELYYNEAVMWFHQLPAKIDNYPRENVLYKR